MSAPRTPTRRRSLESATSSPSPAIASGSSSSHHRPSASASSAGESWSSHTPASMPSAFPTALPQRSSVNEETSGSRFSDLLKSPGKRKAKDYGDRFIPTRDGSDLSAAYHLFGDNFGEPSSSASKAGKQGTGEIDAQKEEANSTFSTILKAELLSYAASPSQSSSPASALGASYVSTVASSIPPTPSTPSRARHLHHSAASAYPISPPINSPTTPTKKRIFTYSSPSCSPNHISAATDLDDPTHEAYSISPVTSESQRLLLSPRKPPRIISKGPFKVLDAPDLADDYYLNLVDWSSTNVLGVGLGSCVYLWSANTSKVTKLCDLSSPPGSSVSGDSITSLSWTARGNTVAVGTDKGEVQIWDAERCKKLRTMTGHTARVGCLAWNESTLSSGSRDRHILHRDTRAPEQHFRTLAAHRQEVCGLRWNVEENQLASGGNDNKLLIWNGADKTEPTWRFSEHTAAVKAIAWSPHQRGILASGGGTADKKIRFWNTLTGTMLSSTDTGSQVCNLMWSKTSNEIVSTHGYSGGPVQNQVCIWKYPSMSQVAVLQGHTYRVLYLAMSPDGQTICTGAGDETLRFWNAFQRAREPKAESSALNPFSAKIR